jgi:hypothetical protein
MKYFFLLLFALAANVASAQDSLSAARLKPLRGAVAPFSTFAKNDSLFLICFWASSSDESMNELNAINANLEKWKTAVPFRMLGISEDEGKMASRVRGIYNMNSWTFEVFTDLYGDLRRALQSNNLPQSMILFKDKIVYQQSGWTAGAENYLFQKLVAIHAGQ